MFCLSTLRKQLKQKQKIGNEMVTKMSPKTIHKVLAFEFSFDRPSTNRYQMRLYWLCGQSLATTYRFGNYLRVLGNITCDLKEHPGPFITLCIIIRNIWNSTLLVSGCFHPCLAAVKRYIHSFNAMPTSGYCISLNCYLNTRMKKRKLKIIITDSLLFH